MTYMITPELAASVSDPELAFSTTRLLPELEDIPAEFKDASNPYYSLTRTIFYDDPLPEMEMEIKDGYSPEILNKCIRAHLGSYGPEHEHKLAGVAYMMSLMATLQFPSKPEVHA